MPPPGVSDPPIDPSIDPSAYSDLDVLGTVQALGPWWTLLVAGLDPAVTRVRPAPGAASFHELAAEQAIALEAALRRLAPSHASTGDADVEALAEHVHDRAAGRLAQPAVRAALDELLVASLSLLRRAGRTLAATGALGPPATGEVHALFTSDGGLPKLAVPSIAVGPRGAAGDRQRVRRHHGRPWQALCLWSLQAVERLAAEGHPIAPGSAGENVCVSGLDWAAARPGTRLRIGDDVVVELSLFALPCRQNTRWFLAGDFMRMHHDREPGISRMYASVLQTGSIVTGDPVELLP